MRRLLVTALVLVPITAVALGRDEVPPISVWDDAPMLRDGVYPPQAPRQQFMTVRIDTVVSYIRYLFMQKQAVILPQEDMFHFFFSYNNASEHVRTIVSDEAQVMGGSWIVTDIWEQSVGGQLRYVCPTAHWEDTSDAWFPEVCVNIWPGPGGDPSVDLTYWFIDEGGLGVGLWPPPMDVGDDSLDFYLPLVEAGPSNEVSIVGQTRAAPLNDWIVFKTFDGWSGAEILPPRAIFTDTVPHSQGYENTQLLQDQERIVVATAGYATDAFTDPTNPLLIVYCESTDGGQSWSDPVWIDQTLVPDMPGTNPGINGHWSNSFFDGLIDPDGDLHFICAIVDSGTYNNISYVHGLYDVHQDNGAWTASLVCDGTYYINADSTWDPRSQFLDGDTYMHGPTLALNRFGSLVAAWSDLGYYDPADSSLWFDVWYAHSANGNAWRNPAKVTYTTDANESFPRLIDTTTDDYAYILTTYDWADGPLDMIQVFAWPPGSAHPGGAEPAAAFLSAEPNPFSDGVTVSFRLTAPGVVEAGVYNARGELVEDLLKGQMRAGTHSLVWNSGDAAPGVYFARVNVGEETLSTRMVLVK
jgi:hypothetical protein